MKSLTEEAVRNDAPTGSGGAALTAAGPLAVLAVVAFALALVVTGGDELEMASSPFGIAASFVGLAALVALALGLGSLGGRPELARGIGRAGWLVAFVGTVLAVGGQWAQLFVLPGLVDPAPDLASNGIGSVVAGYIGSYIVLGVGWTLVGVALLRARTVPRGVAWALLVGGLICIPPLPVRFVVVAVAVAVLQRRLAH